jgi:hypothetical protein
MRTVAAPVGYTRREIGKAIVAAPTLERDMMDKAEKDADKRDVIGNLNAYRRTFSEAEKVGIISKIIGKKQMKDALDENIVGEGNVLSSEEALRTYKKARVLRNKDAIEGIEFSFAHKPEVIKKFAKIVDEETKGYKPEDRTGPIAGRPEGLNKKDVEERGYDSYANKIIAGAITADDIKKLQKGWWENPEAIEAAHKFWTGHQIGEAARIFGRTFSDNFRAKAKPIKWYFEVDPITHKIRNPNVPRYLASSAARNLGVAPLEGGETIQKINKLQEKALKDLKEWREKEGERKTTEEEKPEGEKFGRAKPIWKK